MPSEDARQKLVGQVSDKLKKIANIDVDSLGRSDDLGPQINFDDIVPDLDALLQPFRDLESRNFDALSASDLNHINTQADSVIEVVTEIQNFSISGSPSPSSTAEDIKTRAKNLYDQVIHHLLRSLVFTATQSTNYASLEREAQGLVANIRATIGGFESDLSVKKAEIDNALEDIKRQAAEAGAAQTAIHFREAADHHKCQSHKWMIATRVFLGVVLGSTFLFVILALLLEPPSVGKAVQVIAAKIVFLSAATFGLVWCARNYKSHKHNQVVNEHRQHALSTFQTFADGARTDSVREAVLLAGAQAAFIGRPTGYEGGESDSGMSPSLQSTEAVARIVSRVGGSPLGPAASQP